MGTIVTVPPAQPGQQAPAQPVRRAARFLGVDGPRWFLRGLITGPAAESAENAAVLESVFRDIVVVRGRSRCPSASSCRWRCRPRRPLSSPGSSRRRAGRPPANLRRHRRRPADPLVAGLAGRRRCSAGVRRTLGP
ncbi:DUF3710 domain-containing protein [Blastococcus brunescens]|uniref:DUF3710 domain-containing protein n=1 Tax=Blastococcus brunescens TaxID=1564165 RepID=A0ABZ1BBK3_9ACTN|nr:DUF3710 domain-containing protein [Blastococcus sp. BMG 8361]WRL67054.1 DUF3710 domain-containing protein [Blastococcus sp. BMG 8361]